MGGETVRSAHARRSHPPPCRDRAEGEEVTPTVFLLVFAFLAFAVLAIKYFVRSGDVLHGGYIEDSDHHVDGEE
jgi:hypothetical protein